MLSLRLAQQSDIQQLIEVERSAGQLFLQLAELQFIADDEGMSPQQHADFIAQQREWLMVDADGQVAGFIAVQSLLHGWHIAELSVAANWQRQGVGKKLIAEVMSLARQQGAPRLTLTTFVNVPWNAPYYQRLGFRRLSAHQLDAQLQGLLAEEIKQGLAAGSRCVMEFTLL
ncbi:GNAT family N-acetyltransferase [Serratia aquatilis]|uniref:GNAT family N-acetyltransferase n=1 Tax=Serratia aquatilis TaxID=1737515 RepID=A0ABV6ECK1_9GAMM